MEPRPLYAIAREIRADWKRVYFGAVPYLDAGLDWTIDSDTCVSLALRMRGKGDCELRRDIQTLAPKLSTR